MAKKKTGGKRVRRPKVEVSWTPDFELSDISKKYEKPVELPLPKPASPIPILGPLPTMGAYTVANQPIDMIDILGIIAGLLALAMCGVGLYTTIRWIFG